jgi:deazaflavin-dependent oxidoreductase (nitroreductase family)
VTTAPHRPLQLRAIALAKRVAHRVTGGRVGSLDAADAAPRGGTLKAITALHRALYRWTGGIVGGDAGGLPTLLLTTVGRKTGQPRTVPLPYFPHADGWAIVASFAGNAKNPAWYDNLVATPEVHLQIRRRRVQAIARPAGPGDRPAIWAAIVASAPMYADYQRKTEREIPVVVLRPR